MTALYILAFLFLLAIVIFVHEFGHLRAMNRYGVKVKKLAVGIPIPWVTITMCKPWLCYGTPVSISPILVGGYVLPSDDDEVDNLSTSKILEIYGAGIHFNIILAILLIVPFARDIKVAGLFMLLMVVLFALEKVMCRFVWPVASFALISLVPLFLTASWRAIGDTGAMSSEAISNVVFTITSFRTVVMYGALASLLTAVLNLIPLLPLDGGHIVKTILQRFLPEKIVVIFRTLAVLCGLIVITICTYDFILAIARLLLRAIFP